MFLPDCALAVTSRAFSRDLQWSSLWHSINTLSPHPRISEKQSYEQKCPLCFSKLLGACGLNPFSIPHVFGCEDCIVVECFSPLSGLLVLVILCTALQKRYWLCLAESWKDSLTLAHSFKGQTCPLEGPPFCMYMFSEELKCLHLWEIQPSPTQFQHTVECKQHSSQNITKIVVCFFRVLKTCSHDLGYLNWFKWKQDHASEQ